MSDDEGGKKSGYRLEYASSARAKCKGPKPCQGTQIGKGELRVGSLVDFKGNTSFSWRHWGCTTTKILANMKKSFEEASELDGYEDLRPEDQAKIDTAWTEGKVADEDVPESARKPAKDGEDEEEKPKKKRAPAKKKAKLASDAEEDDEDAEEKPKKKRAAPKKKAPAEKKERAAPKKRAPKKKKDDSGEESGEDFTAAIDEVEDDDEPEAVETDEEGSSKKRKRSAPKSKTTKPPSKKSKPSSSRAKKSKAVSEDDEDED